MIGVSEFCKQPFMLAESVCAIAPFLSAALMFYLTLRTLANVLLDRQFWKKDVHPFFIKYHSLVYLTICN